MFRRTVVRMRPGIGFRSVERELLQQIDRSFPSIAKQHGNERADTSSPGAVSMRWVEDTTAADSHNPLPSSFTSDEQAGTVPFSLNRFFREMKRLKKSSRELTKQESRTMLHKEIESFWGSQIDSAVQHLQTARDVGFLANFGLSSRELHASRSQLRAMCRLLVEGKTSVTPYDCCVALRYIAREVETLSRGSGTGSPDNLHTFLNEFGLERLSHYFVPAPNRSWVIGNPISAVQALEFIATMTNQSADRKYLILLSPLTKVVDAVFRTAIQDDATQLNTTNIIRLFALLRIFRSLLGEKPSARIAVTLVKGLRFHDSTVINPYHVVKVVVSLSRIKPLKNSHHDDVWRKKNVDEQRKQLQVRQQGIVSLDQPPLTKATHTDEDDPLQKEKLWEYLVSKVCLSFSNMNAKEQELIYVTVRDILSDRDMMHLMGPLDNERNGGVSNVVA